MARRKIGMSNKERFYRSFGLMSAFLMLLSCFALITFLVMDIVGINVFEREAGPRKYYIAFYSEERFISGADYIRGEKIDIPGNPVHGDDDYFRYTFRGWDINGDGNPDLVPKHAYYGFDAIAVYQKRQIKPLPKSSSAPSDSNEESNLSIIFEEVSIYGAQ